MSYGTRKYGTKLGTVDTLLETNRQTGHIYYIKASNRNNDDIGWLTKTKIDFDSKTHTWTKTIENYKRITPEALS